MVPPFQGWARVREPKPPQPASAIEGGGSDEIEIVRVGGIPCAVFGPLERGDTVRIAQHFERRPGHRRRIAERVHGERGFLDVGRVGLVRHAGHPNPEQQAIRESGGFVGIVETVF